MHTISLVTQKGGTGKSTLAVNLANAAGADGKKVCIIDLDPQGTTLHWFSIRTQEEPAVIGPDDARDLAGTISKLGQHGYDLTIIDTPGFDSPVTRDAIRVSDLCLVPVRPSEADLQATMPTLKAVVALARPYALVINQAPAQRMARLTTAVYMRLASEGPVLPAVVSARVDFQYAFALGVCVTEYSPEGKASQEIKELWQAVKKRVNDEKEPSARGSNGKTSSGRLGRGSNLSPVRAFG